MSPFTPSLCSSFFEHDAEYPDLECGNPALERYLELIYSADYGSISLIHDDRGESLELNRGESLELKDLPLPPHVLTVGRRITPALKVKIWKALALWPLASKPEMRVYQLFKEVKLFGYRYNARSKDWEFCL